MDATNRMARSVEAAQQAERFGYSRFPVAEHHGRLIAGATPEVLLGRLTAETDSIRLGSRFAVTRLTGIC